ncbi:MAG: R3H domain-containing nucleic acid-binding protein [Patescibacteria group bacterium]
MEKFESIIKQAIELMGFDDFSVSHDSDSGRFSIFINDNIITEINLPAIVSNFDIVFKLIAQKNNIFPIFIDINNYRKKRENLILELARAAAKKTVAEKNEMQLPAMNAYERRLIHTELSKHPDVKTESIGEGKERCVVIKSI